MYQLNLGAELSPVIMTKILQQFQTTDLPKLQKLKDYFDGKQAILSKISEDDSKKYNHTVVNYCHNIVDNYMGYIAGIPIKYDNKMNEQATQDLLDILKYNDVTDEDSEYLRQALIYGKSFELNYIDEDGKQRFAVLDARECIPVYDTTVEQKLIYVIRFYREDLWDEEKRDNYIVEVYTPAEVIKYQSNIGFSTFTEIERYTHFYQQCPVTVFRLNDDEASIFAQIMSLQDSYNELLSGEVDDFEAFADAFLVLKGVQADEDNLDSMKKHRVLMIDNDCDASYLTKSISDTQIENMLTNINDQIHKIANSPDFNDEKFMAQSGIAMRFKLVGFENNASNIESHFRKALTRRIENISAVMALTDTEEVWREIEITFTRNLPTDLTEQTNVVNSLRGLVSDRTLLGLLPFITDVDAEMDEVATEKQANMEMYSFGNFNTTPESEVIDNEDEQTE